MNWFVFLLPLLSLLTTTKAELNWKRNKIVHNQNLDVFSARDTDYFANKIANERNFREHLDAILIPRVPGTVGNEQVRNHIVRTLQDLGYTTEIESSNQKTPHGNVDFHNVIGTLDANAPRRLVLACHYDSKKTPRGFLGATDSAVPCAQMLNLAHAMRRDLNDHKSKSNEVTLQLVFFDGEEAFERWQGNDNTYGARDLAYKWERKTFSHDGIEGNHLDRMDMLVLLDLIGAKNPNFVSLQRSTNDWFKRLVGIERRLAKMDTFERGSRKRLKPIFLDPAKRANFGQHVEDDHVPFQKRGVNILHLIAVPFPDVWHKRSDNLSAVDFPTVADLNKIFRVFVAEYLQLQK